MNKMKIEVNKKAEAVLQRVMKHADCSYSSAILFMDAIVKLRLRNK